MSRARFVHTYDDIISVENLLAAWKEFVRGKRKKSDVQEFQYRLMENIIALHLDLVSETYRHGGYKAFRISDPKPRDIHKATVRDRLLHHAIYRKLYPFFDKTFVADSYSCRKGKGTHRAMNRFRRFAHKVSHNHTRTCWVLKCDIRKFFASIDQRVLLHILRSQITNERTFHLLTEVISSFCSCCAIHSKYATAHNECMRIGLPLGNLTSQLLVNIYMNEFDQYVKHSLKEKYYVRYADDFVVLSHDKSQLIQLVRYIELFLRECLKLKLHPDKVFIKTVASGVDFLGWVHFSDHRVLRTSTKRRVGKRTAGEPIEATLTSYIGLMSYGNAERLCEPLREKLESAAR